MDTLQVIILGIVQGLTEFIPVSSSGHLSIIPTIFGWDKNPTSFDIFLHGGTLLALIIFFRVRILSYIKIAANGTKLEQQNLLRLLIASIPAIIFAFIITVGNKLTDNSIDNVIKNTWVEVFSLVLVGIVMILVDRYFQSNQKKIEDLTIKDALILGFVQSIALIRGISRSGITIITGIYLGYKREEAAEISFLIGIPVLAIAFIYEIIDLIANGADDISIAHLLLGFAVSFFSGLIAIKFLLNYIKQYGLAIFGIYRIIFAIIVILILAL